MTLTSVCMPHLCKVKIVRVCLLLPQPHRDEDDDGSAVWRGGGRRWLVVLWRRRSVRSLSRGLPCCWCPVAINDISTVHYGGSITQKVRWRSFCLRLCLPCQSIIRSVLINQSISTNFFQYSLLPFFF